LSKPIASIFATRLKAARELRGLSQRALGGLVSESKSNGSVRINRYEQGVNRADMDTAAALAAALGVPLAYLFAEKDDQAELLLTFAKLPSGDRAKLLALAKQMAEKRDRQGTKSP
jgi:transcriptional regulator with XRE-family HTH domain